MPATLFVPASGSWAFAPAAPPVAWALPVGSDGGIVTLEASTPGSTPTNGQGVVFSVSFDGVLAYTSACMESGTDAVVVPPGTLTIDVTAVYGCHGGPTTTSATVTGVST